MTDPNRIKSVLKYPPPVCQQFDWKNKSQPGDKTFEWTCCHMHGSVTLKRLLTTHRWNDPGLLTWCTPEKLPAGRWRRAVRLSRRHRWPGREVKQKHENVDVSGKTNAEVKSAALDGIQYRVHRSDRACYTITRTLRVTEARQNCSETNKTSATCSFKLHPTRHVPRMFLNGKRGAWQTFTICTKLWKERLQVQN